MTLEPSDSGPGDRIAKVMARAGVCSRRQAETLIAQGSVSVNGKRLTSPAFNVYATDKIEVDGRPLPEKQPTRLWKYYKPKGVLCSRSDPNGLLTLPEALKEVSSHLPYVISVGRLDFNSEGLLLLTNDGTVARALELPSTGWIRQYKVRVKGAPSQKHLDQLLSGITVDAVTYGSIEASLVGSESSGWLMVKLREGKNREIRKVMEHLGFPVIHLTRISYGPFQLGNMPRNSLEEIPAKVVREQLGRWLTD